MAETTTRTVYVNDSPVVFQIEEEEEFLLEKLKEFISSNLDTQNDRLDLKVKHALRQFLEALIEADSEYGSMGPAVQGILNLRCDTTFVQWFNRNLETFWT